MTGDRFRDSLGVVERTDIKILTRPLVMDDLSIASILFVSYTEFEMLDIDFGEALGGKVEAFRPPFRGLLADVPVLLPRLPDESCEFVITEQEEAMRLLAEDDIFWRYANK